MDEDPIRALTGRRRTRPTSPGCRKPQQPKPGRTPLIAVYAAVQINRATSVLEHALDPSGHKDSGQHACIGFSPLGVAGRYTQRKDRAGEGQKRGLIAYLAQHASS